jgi:hypothetical protein
MITKQTKIPENSILRKEKACFDYVDCFQGFIVIKEKKIEITDFLELFLHGGPKWVDFLLALRDRIVRLFGLKTQEQMAINKKPLNNVRYNTGDQLGIFKFFNQSDNEFVLGENDKHLNFRVSLMLEPLDGKIVRKKLSITTVVKFNNTFGRIYFFPVKPFHKFIVRATLKRIVQQLERKQIQNAEILQL